jgi:transcriptional regulator with XRE-family HTH domain
MTADDAPTKLERFLREHGIKPAQLARLTGYARPHLVRIRLGRVTPHRRTKQNIAIACGILTRKTVTVEELFD